MTDRVPPHNIDAEEALLGAMLLSRAAIDTVLEVGLTAVEFYKPANQHIYAAIEMLYEQGEPSDPVTVAETLRRHGVLDLVGGPGTLMTLLAGTPSTSSAGRYARIVIEHAALRRLITAAVDITDIGYGMPNDVADAIDQARALLEAIDLPAGRVPADLHRLAELADRGDDQRAPWVIPGLLRRDWRAVLVAREGLGKSILLQSVGMAAGQGVHPFSFRPITPVRVLFVDAENPEDRIVEGARLIEPHVRRTARAIDDDRVWIWHRPGGLNLRGRADRATLDAVLAAVRPELVCIGPAYKLATRDRGEGWDEQALGTQRVLDELRTRFGFALLMEDHAPQAQGGVRDIRPFGSSAWLRWPEIGIKLLPDDKNPPSKLTLGRWRGDRLRNAWPDELHRGGTHSWPWVGYWAEGDPTRHLDSPEEPF